MVRLPGTNDTADWLGIDRDTMGKLNSPIDVTLLQSFAKWTEHHPGEPLWEIMCGIGSELVTYLTTLRSRIDRTAEIEQVWTLGDGEDAFRVLFAPRTDPHIEEVSGALGWRVRELGLEEEVVALVYPDGRGEGYGMRRYDDSPVVDFSRLGKERRCISPTTGFIAKTSCTQIERLKELFSGSGPDALSRNGHKVGVDQPAPEDEYLGQEIQDDAVFLPGEPDHAPGTGTDHVNDDAERMNVQGMQTNCG